MSRSRFATGVLRAGVMRNPPLAVGEAYMDGDFSVEDGTRSFMDLLFLNTGWGTATGFWKRCIGSS